MRFLGSAENFDLWFLFDADDGHKTHPLYVHRVTGGAVGWDFFPRAVTAHGFYRNVHLSAEDMKIIEAYLRNEAPWVLNKENKP
jgi:hypothetical protein